MPTILDQATVFTEFDNVIPADVSAPLRPHIAGGEATLRRYAVAAEKAELSLGDYDPIEDQVYDYPDLPAGAVVDLDSVAVYIDDALLEYFDKPAGGTAVAIVAGYTDRVRYAAANGFVENGEDYTRLTALADRDVQVGDVVKLVDGADEQVTAVAGFAAEVIAGSIGSASGASTNAVAQPNSLPGAAPTATATGGGATGGSLQAGDYFIRYSFTGPFGETWASDASAQLTVAATNIPRVTIPALPTGATSARIYLSPTNGTADQCTLYKTGVTTTTTDLTTAYAGGGAAYPKEIEQIDGDENDVIVTDVDASTYSGEEDGDITETYTIVVTTGGNATNARLEVTSASGRDDESDVTPAAFGDPTDIGSRGLTVTFDNTSDDFVVGQTWQVTVRQLWAVPVATAAGTFTGDADVNYVVRVTRGGLYADATDPQITVSTAEGTDVSGPTTVTAAASAVAVGTLGVTIAFSGTGLRLGDVYVIPVTGPTDGAYKTIILRDNLIEELQASTDMGLTLYLKKNITVPRQRVSAPPAVNWTAAAGSVTVEAGIDAYDESLTDSDVEFAVPVSGGTVYVGYRAWVDGHAGGVHEVSTVEDVEAEFGLDAADIVPDHGLAYALKMATLNSNGQAVRYSGVADPSDVDLWTEVLDMLEGDNAAFTLVPLTRDPDVIALYRDHVIARSADDIGGEWRHAWFNLESVDEAAVVDATTSSDEEVVLATLADDPGTSGTQYTRFSVTTGNGKFVTNGVLPGDEVRYLYTVDGFGDEAYTSFVVEEVVNEDTLVVTAGHSVAVATAQRLEVWRARTRSQSAAALAAEMTGDNVNKRFKFLWPDQFTDDDGNVAAGYHLCAAYAGAIGGIAPHQGLRNVSISGVSAVPRSTTYFNNGQLNTLAEAGFVVVTKAPASAGGEVYAKFARTPDDTELATREESVVRLDDAIRYLMWGTVANFHGKANLTASAIALIRSTLQSAIQHAVSDTRIDRIGSMITTASVDDVRRHASIEDRLVLAMTITRPVALNDTTLELLLSF